ncbi:hypothetical protein AHF37_03763 [Paragonimus kellicotti]|nr:hypothetical protein AHF37_03763 [Paragonimus kellicotti]
MPYVTLANFVTLYNITHNYECFRSPLPDETMRAKLLDVQRKLYKALRVARSGSTRILLQQAIIQLAELDHQTDTLVPQPYAATLRQPNTTDELPETCPEYWDNPQLDKVYFENVYKTQPCERVPLDQLVELLLFAETCAQANHLIERVRKVYPTVRIRLALGDTIDRTGVCGNWHSVELFPELNDEASTWRKLAETGRTKYILVGRNMVDMTHYTDLDRMLRVMNNLSVDVVGGAVRLEPEGRWYPGCYQSSVRNFTIRLHPGHDMSAQSCAYCDYIASPFLVRRDVFQQSMSKSSMSGLIPFVQFFLSGLHNIDSNRVLTTVACVDVLFHVAGAVGLRGQGLAETPKSSWSPLAQKWSINRIVLPGQVDHRWTCKEAGINCAHFKRAGLIMPGCCLEELANCVKGFLTLAAEHNVSAFLVSGTNLGAVKTYGGFLPWERDADILLGWIQTRSSNWRIELYGEPILVSERLWGLKHPTSIAINGIWATTVPNPGLALRHQYGDNILGHIQHWMDLGYSTGWSPYTHVEVAPFSPCPKDAIRHACLSGNYLPQGNIQFQDFPL